MGPFYMFLFGITLVPLSEELFRSTLDLLGPFYVDDAAFDGPAERSARLRTLLLNKGLMRVYFPELAKSLFICD